MAWTPTALYLHEKNIYQHNLEDDILCVGGVSYTNPILEEATLRVISLFHDLKRLRDISNGSDLISDYTEASVVSGTGIERLHELLYGVYEVHPELFKAPTSVPVSRVICGILEAFDSTDKLPTVAFNYALGIYVEREPVVEFPWLLTDRCIGFKSAWITLPPKELLANYHNTIAKLHVMRYLDSLKINKQFSERLLLNLCNRYALSETDYVGICRKLPEYCKTILMLEVPANV